MYSDSKSPKAVKGSVQIKNSNDRLQLVFTYAGKRHYLSTGFQDTSTNQKLAQMKARQIELDILSGNFDPTLAKYKPQVALSTVTPTVTPISEPQSSLAELWEKYTEFKTPSLSPSTIAKDYARIENCIKLLPATSPRDAISIRDWLIANKTPDATKRVLTQLSACCDWAVKSQIATTVTTLP